LAGARRLAYPPLRELRSCRRVGLGLLCRSICRRRRLGSICRRRRRLLGLDLLEEAGELGEPVAIGDAHRRHRLPLMLDRHLQDPSLLRPNLRLEEALGDRKFAAKKQRNQDLLGRAAPAPETIEVVSGERATLHCPPSRLRAWRTLRISWTLYDPNLALSVTGGILID